MYRDSLGRTRREGNHGWRGALGAARGPADERPILIHDPVAGVSYHLDARTSHTAHKMAMGRAGGAGGDHPAGFPAR